MKKPFINLKISTFKQTKLQKVLLVIFYGLAIYIALIGTFIVTYNYYDFTDNKPIIKNLEIGYFEFIIDNSSVMVIENFTMDYDSTKLNKLMIDVQNMMGGSSDFPVFTEEDAERYLE